jgi:hypothetical protein
MGAPDSKGRTVEWVSAIATALAAIVALSLGVVATCQNKSAIEQGHEMLARTDSSLAQGRMLLMRTDSSLQQGRMMLDRTDSSLEVARSGLRQQDSSLAIAAEANRVARLQTELGVDLDLRPYLAFHYDTLRPYADKTDSTRRHVRTILTIKNLGKSNAFFVRATHQVGARELSLSVGWSDSSGYEVIPPGDSELYPITLPSASASADPQFVHFFCSWEYRLPKTSLWSEDSVVTFVYQQTLLADPRGWRGLRADESRFFGRPRTFTAVYEYPRNRCIPHP